MNAVLTRVREHAAATLSARWSTTVLFVNAAMGTKVTHWYNVTDLFHVSYQELYGNECFD